MLVKEIMTREVVWCTPEDTVCHAANLMKVHGVGAIPVVWNLADPLVEGIVTDRDLCCGVLAGGKHGDTVTVAEIMKTRCGESRSWISEGDVSESCLWRTLPFMHVRCK